MSNAGVTISQRLRAAGLRSTMARVCVLQAVEAARLPVSAEDLFRSLIERGTHTSIGTVYRVLGLFETRGLVVRERDAERKALYRMKLADSEVSLRLACRGCGRCVQFSDASLHGRLAQIAGSQGIALARDGIRIEVDCVECGACEAASARMPPLRARAERSAAAG